MLRLLNLYFEKKFNNTDLDGFIYFTTFKNKQKYFFIVELIYNIVLVSSVHKNDLVMCVYIYILCIYRYIFQNVFSYRLL